jgi:regulator of protease activity HflC (stomatin/prohibitin superfamily)
MIRTVLLATLTAAALLMGGCSDTDGGEPVPVTTTTSAPDPVETTSTIPGRTPDQIAAALNQAIGRRDFCGVVAALDTAVPDVRDGDQVIEVYDTIADAAERTTSFAPEELRAAWDEVVAATRRGADAARRAEGNLEDPILRAPFTANVFDAAMTVVEAWSDRNCR